MNQLDENDIQLNNICKNTNITSNYLDNDIDFHILHDDVRRDLEMHNMSYEKYINSSEYYVKQKYVDQFFESKYEKYISICSFINVFRTDEISLYNVCNFYKIYFNSSHKKYYFRTCPENANIFSSDNWPDMKVFLINFIDEYLDKINKDKAEKERLMFEDIRKYILIKGISRQDFVDMIKL